MKTMKNIKKTLLQTLLIALPLGGIGGGLVSCSEKSEGVDEYADWQSRNQTYFEQQYQAHSAMNIIKKWTLDPAYDAPHTDCILVDRLENGSGTVTPYYTDTVKVHYRGRLIPSVSYPEGYEFDKSWKGTFDEATAVPETFSMNDLIMGFSTALQYMHKGDTWRVIVPYQLGYGTAVKDDIPAYSTLIFEIHLVDFWSNKKGDRN